MILGIDPGSLVSGFCLYDAEKKDIINCWEVKLRFDDLRDKCNFIDQEIKKIFADNSIYQVVIEKMFIRNKNATNLLAVQKVIAEAVKKMRIDCVEYAPMVWQNFMGKGGMDKQESAEKIIEVFGIHGMLDESGEKVKHLLNASDAAALAICGAANNFKEKITVKFDEYVTDLL